MFDTTNQLKMYTNAEIFKPSLKKIIDISLDVNPKIATKSQSAIYSNRFNSTKDYTYILEV